MTDKLPPNLLALFAPRPPVRYLPAADAALGERKTAKIDGLAQYLEAFKAAEPTDDWTESWLERRDRLQLEKLEEHKKQLADAAKIYKPSEDPSIKGDPYKTLFVSRLSYEVSESDLEREFGRFGPIERIRLVNNGADNEDAKAKKQSRKRHRGYAFIVFEREKDAKAALRETENMTMSLKGRPVVVDVERGRTVRDWKPRRFGGGLGGREYTKQVQRPGGYGQFGGSGPGGPGGFPSGPGGFRQEGFRQEGFRPEFRGGFRGGFRGDYGGRGGFRGDRGGLGGDRGGGGGGFGNGPGGYGGRGGIGYQGSNGFGNRGGFGGGANGTGSGSGSAPSNAPSGPSYRGDSNGQGAYAGSQGGSRTNGDRPAPYESSRGNDRPAERSYEGSRGGARGGGGYDDRDGHRERERDRGYEDRERGSGGRYGDDQAYRKRRYEEDDYEGSRTRRRY